MEEAALSQIIPKAWAAAEKAKQKKEHKNHNDHHLKSQQTI